MAKENEKVEAEEDVKVLASMFRETKKFLKVIEEEEETT